MKKLLPVKLTILSLLVSTFVYLTPLYPVYAESSASPSAKLKRTEKIMDLKEKVLEKKEESLKNREEMKAMTKDKLASREAMLKEKLAKFKDKVKAQRVETINTNLNEINKKRVKQMLETLSKISKFLETLKEKTNMAEKEGKDVTSIKAAISKAETAWQEADTVLKDQVEKDYSIEVNKESTVKQDAMTARDNLRNDLQSVHQKVVDARQSLVDVIQIIVKTLTGLKVGGSNGEQ